MSKARIIYKLPTLTANQEWCCERGCDVTEPVLHENIYSHNLTTGEKQSEYYYVCRFCNTKLMIWDNSINKHVDAAEEYYQEPVSTVDSNDTVRIIERAESLAARFIDKKYHGATGRILRKHPNDPSCYQVKVSGGGMIWVNEKYLEPVENTVVMPDEIWSQAPSEAFHWERFPNGKCVWHCRNDGKSFSKKAPNFEIQQNSVWRDADKQKEADQMKASVNAQLAKFNISLSVNNRSQP